MSNPWLLAIGLVILAAALWLLVADTRNRINRNRTQRRNTGGDQ